MQWFYDRHLIERNPACFTTFIGLFNYILCFSKKKEV
jgi:hypothetical protein